MASEELRASIDKTLSEFAAVQGAIDNILEGKHEKRRRRQLTLTRILLLPLKLVILAVLPFFLLIRASVFAFDSHDWSTWTSLALGIVMAGAVLTLYGAWFSKKLTGKARLKFIGTKVALPVAIAFSAYSLIYLSSTNAKTELVRQFYSSVHPILRVAVSTVILIDREIVVTDLQRTPEDYIRMGLPVRESSLHYPGPDGYVYAMDLRMIGRSKRRNQLVESYFRWMGFRTLRHVGTADHLHVALRPPEATSSSAAS